MNSGIKASDIMTSRVITVTPDMDLAKVAKLMNKFRIGGVPVVDGKSKFLGILSERDVMAKVVAVDKQPRKIKVKEVMTATKITATPETDMNDIAKLMSEHDVSRVPITNGTKLIGIVTNRDIVKYGPDLLEVLLEHAKLRRFNPRNAEPTAFDNCEICGEKSHLTFRNNKFLCDSCL